MAKFKNFYNKIMNSNRIFTREDIGAMSSDEFRKHEKAIDYQLQNLGVPTNADMYSSNEVTFINPTGNDSKGHYRAKFDGITGGAAGVEYAVSKKKPLTFAEGTLQQLSKPVSLLYPIAGDNLQNAMYDMKKAKKNKNAKVFNSRDELNGESFENFMDNLGIKKDTRGVFYYPESEHSKKLGESKEINDFIEQNYDKLKNKQIPSAQIEFKEENNKDNYLGLQHVTLHNPHIDEQGNFNTTVVDLYDFAKREGKGLPTLLNNWGYQMQEKNRLENQFNLYYIRKKLMR